jgi:hypothetical protein
MRQLAAMPLGVTYEETGLLLREGRGLVLCPDAGGTWRLDAGRDAERLVGRRVKLVGVRAGFDLLDVQSIEAV